MDPSTTSPSRPTRRRHSGFHYLLVLFAAPARIPVGLIYLAAVAIAAALAWLWVGRLSRPGDALLVFLIMGSFFLADRDLLASLPRRGLSFGPWQSQFFALVLPRSAVALVFGLLVPLTGWAIAFYTNIAIQFLGSVLLHRAAIVEPGQLALARLAVTTDRLPAGSTPLCILHISDLHIERLGRRESRLLDLVASAAPDFIFLTGDYVNLSFNRDPVTHGQVRELLGQLTAPGGVFAVLGSPAVDLPDVVPPLFADLPVRLLRNEAVELTSPAGQTIQLIGLDCRHDIAVDTLALDDATAAVIGGGPRFLLYHSPELMPQAVERGFDLYLCGHTHGGQVRLPFIGAVLTSSKLGRRYVMGHYHEGRTHLYVSRGVGFEGLGAPRVRFRCPPEMTLVELSGKQPPASGE